MEVLISGEAGLAAVMGGRVQIRPLGKAPYKVASPGTATAIFRGCSDVLRYNVRNVAEADARLLEAYSLDRAIRLLAIACDDDTFDNDVPHLRSLIAGLVINNPVRTAFQRRLFADVIGEQHIARFALLADGSDELADVLTDVLQHQARIETVLSQWRSLGAELFDDADHRNGVWSSFVVEGSIREWARSGDEKTASDFLYLSFVSRHRHLRNIDAILRKLLEHKPSAKSAAVVRNQIDAEEWNDDFAGEYGSDHAAFENALAQQRAIADKIKAKDFPAARAFLEDLIQQQLASSGAARTAKSLCRLAQIAKQEGAPDMQLELASRACEIFPDDPQNHGHLADALIGFGRYADAETAIATLEALGDNLFAQTQRARILRLRGQWQQARDLYLQAAKAFDEHLGVEHAWAGAAETLRDMGLMGDAIAEYRVLVERWPNNPNLRSGLASALMEAGHLEEALKTFGKAAVDDRSAIPMNGRATAYKMAGDLARSENVYREVMSRFPDDPATNCGFGDVLRLRGSYAEAMDRYQKAHRIVPLSHIPILGIADVLRDQGQFEAAIKTLTEQPEEITRHVQTSLSIAMNLKLLGRFSDALLRYDQAIHENPHYTPARLAKADLLRRIGRFDAAIPLYNQVMSTGLMVNLAGAGLAACLIAQGNLDRADRLLPESVPKTQSDWQKYLARGSLLEARGASRRAMRHLERGIARCPYDRQVKLMRNLLASIQLSRRDEKAALRTAVQLRGETSNVVYLHALAANHRTGQARQVLQEGPWQADVLRLGQGIARLYDFDGTGPGPDRKSVYKDEQVLLLLAA